mgnify:CR=1 FL=1
MQIFLFLGQVVEALQLAWFASCSCSCSCSCVTFPNARCACINAPAVALREYEGA